MSEAPSKLVALKKLKRRFSGYGGSLTVKLKRSLISRENVVTRKLLDSVRTTSRFKWSENKYRLQVEMQAYGLFLNKNFYPRRQPPVDAILRWMDDKGIKIRRDKTKFKIRTRRQLAFMFAKSIAKDGFATYNKHRVGWMDLVVDEEMERLKKQSKKDLLEAVRNITVETLDFNK